MQKQYLGAMVRGNKLKRRQVWSLIIAGIVFLAFPFLPNPAHAVDLPITISPTSGPPGTQITVTGIASYWDAGEVVDIWVQRGDPTVSPVTGADGSFTTAVTIPSDAPAGRLIVTAIGRGEDRKSAQTPFEVTVESPPPPPPVPEPVPTPVQPVFAGLWKGTYVCSQGETGLSLILYASAADTLTGTFSFYATPSNPSLPSGSFTLRGSYSSSDMKLAGDVWITRPPNWIVVDLQSGLPSADGTLSGKVTTEGCTTFSVHRSMPDDPYIGSQWPAAAVSASPNDRKIDMVDACRVEYGGTDLRASTSGSSGPYNWRCYRGSTELGGLPHLDTYCNLRHGGAVVVLTPPWYADNWNCRLYQQITFPDLSDIGKLLLAGKLTHEMAGCYKDRDECPELILELLGITLPREQAELVHNLLKANMIGVCGVGIANAIDTAGIGPLVACAPLALEALIEATSPIIATVE